MNEDIITRLRSAKLNFSSDGLIPAIVQDNRTNELLTLAYMNAESLNRTLESGETWFWSRSRGELWHKGETSGHTQQVIDIRPDCDSDALLIRVVPQGPACHTGARTCFSDASENTEKDPTGMGSLARQLEDLHEVIRDRAEKRPPNSYTTYLFESGLDKILKKIGEEAAETVIAAKNDGRAELTSEISDLLYHLLVLMVARSIEPSEVAAELGRRVGRPVERKYQG
jgi:phosphoribosyl-AMP cyclohydrolase / phosphoribosyl-ATP pyrophosphohydrolase